MHLSRPFVPGLAALLCIAALTVSSCTSAPPAKVDGAAGFGSLPGQAGHPVSGGTVSFAMLTSDAPRYIFPITPAALTTAYTVNEFQHLMWRPLYWQTVGTQPAIDYGLSLAAAPVFSDGGRAVTFTVNGGYHWSDGRPVSAADVVFSIDLLKAAVKESPANWGNYSPGYFPDNVESAVAVGGDTVRLELTQAYNPEWFLLDELSLIVPLPSAEWSRDAASGPAVDYTVPANAARIYDFLNAQAGKLTSYAANPMWQMVDGPFRLSAFDSVTGSFTLVQNKAFTGPFRPMIASFSATAAASEQAESLMFQAGAVTVGQLPSQQIRQADALRRTGYDIYGYPTFGWDYMVFNFKDTTGHWNAVIAQLYVRQALAHLVDQAGYIRSVYDGAAEPAYGPVPTVPRSQFTPADALTDPYPYSVAAATALLARHGWKIVSGGTDTCARPGTGQGDCGAGIPAGTPLAFNLIFNSQAPDITAEDTAFASAARQAGITVTMRGTTLDSIITSYNDVSAPAKVNSWAMADFGGFGQPLYPTTNNIFNTTGSFNFGGYSNPEADHLIRQSLYSDDPAAVRREAAFLTTDLPALFLPDSDTVFAWKKNLSGPPRFFASLTQYSVSPEMWYFTG